MTVVLCKNVRHCMLPVLGTGAEGMVWLNHRCLGNYLHHIRSDLSASSKPAGLGWAGQLWRQWICHREGVALLALVREDVATARGSLPCS